MRYIIINCECHMPQASVLRLYYSIKMYAFNIKGHRNITARHRTTIEFTKDKELGRKGDCVIGTDADFEMDRIKDFISKLKRDKIRIRIKVNGYEEVINGIVNRDFNSEKEIVARKSSYISDRTLMINADKASIDISRKIVGKLANGSKGKVIIYET